MGEFRIDMPIEEILQRMNNSRANTEVMHAGPCFLQHKLQESLLKEQQSQHKTLLDNQNEYNRKQLFHTRNLAFATWILAIATCILAVATFMLKK